MAESTVLTYVTTLSNNKADQTSIANYYTEIIADLNQKWWLTNFQVQAVSSPGQINYDLPTNAVTILGVIYGGRWLQESHLRDLEGLQRVWRKSSTYQGPLTYVLDESSHLTFQVFPAPNLPTNLTTGQGTLITLYTETRTTVPLWLEFSLAFGILSREFIRSSDHTDKDGAALAEQMFQMMLAMLS